MRRAFQQTKFLTVHQLGSKIRQKEDARGWQPSSPQYHHYELILPKQWNDKDFEDFEKLTYFSNHEDDIQS